MTVAVVATGAVCGLLLLRALPKPAHRAPGKNAVSLRQIADARTPAAGEA
jgi:hypothetical protein